mgnify:FL=1
MYPRQRNHGEIYEGGGVVIEKIACVFMWILFVALAISATILFVSAIHDFCIDRIKKSIKNNRIKKLIKSSEQKAVPCHCGGQAYIEHRFGEFYHIGCTVCPVGFTDEDIPKLVKMWNDVQNIKAGDLVDTGVFTGRVKSILHGEAIVYANIYNTNVNVPLQYIKKIKPSSAKVV